MKIAVVTPYYGEDVATLAHCHRSVATQRIVCTHVMVADGRPSAEVENWGVEHVVLPRRYNNYGSTPRAIGSLHAAGLQFDGIAFLDADNWYDREHIASLLDLRRQSGAAFLTSSRLLCRLDGTVMRPCHLTDGTNFVDTSCMLLMREAFGLIANWCLMPDWAQIISDRVFLYYAKAAGIEMAHSGKPTVYYRCGKAGIYHDLGETPPPGVRPKPDYESALQRWSAAGNPPLVPS